MKRTSVSTGIIEHPMRLLCLLSILALSAPPVFSQVMITGSVYDAQTGEALPSATIRVEGNHSGTITNSGGAFSIGVGELPADLIVSYIGYHSVVVSVGEEESFPVHIALSPSVAGLPEDVAISEDPGRSIMWRVIDRKREWRLGLENYRVEAYSRQTLASDTAIVSITESSSIAWWDRELGHREVQISRKQTSNLQDDQNFAGVRYMPNFYDDDVEIAGFLMVGITHPDAMRYYDFRLLETVRIDDRPVYKIQVIPQRNRHPLFAGTAWVLSEEYVLLQVELNPNEVVHFPPPVRELDLTYKQQFRNVDRSYWLPVDMRIDGQIRIGLVGLQFPMMNFHQVSRLSGYQVNAAIPDSIFQDYEAFSRIDATEAQIAVRQADIIPLTDEEERAYETIDTTHTIEQAFSPEGFLARELYREGERREIGPGTLLNRYLPEGLELTGRFNRVDGFNLGLRYSGMLTESTYWTALGNYSFHSKKFDYGTELEQTLQRFNDYEVSLFGGYEAGTNTRYSSRLYSLGINSLATLVGIIDYFDYFRNQRGYAGLRMNNLFRESTLALQVNVENHRTFEEGREYDYSLFGFHRPRRINPEIVEGRLHSLQSTVNMNRSGATFGFTGDTGFELSGEWSDHFLGSDFNFFQVKLDVDLSFRTFYPRRLFSNTLDIVFSGGMAAGTLPLQRFGTVDGSIYRFTPFGSLRTRRSLPYEGSRYWMVGAEHNFGTLPFEFLELRSLVRRGWGVILFGAMGRASAAGDYPQGVMTSDGLHAEVGISLNRIFGVLRLDFAQRLDAKGYLIGVGLPRYF